MCLFGVDGWVGIVVLWMVGFVWVYWCLGSIGCFEILLELVIFISEFVLECCMMVLFCVVILVIWWELYLVVGDG